MTQQHRPDEQEDAADFERLTRALRTSWDEAPEADRTALWNVVQSQLGPQQVPWHVALRNSIANLSSSLQGPARQMAMAGAAVAVVGALFLSGVFQSGNRASAAVLEQVNELSAATAAALADGVLSDEEIADLHERALTLLAEIEDDPEALNELTPEELKLVIGTLMIVGGDLDDFTDEDHGDLDEDFDEAVESILATTTQAETFRQERGDDDGDGDDGDGDERPGALGTAEVNESPEADETSEAGEADEGDETPEATGTPESDGTPEADGTADADEDDEADETPEATGTPKSDGTPESGSDEDSESDDEDDE